MTDVDRMTDLTDDELRLRAELPRTLVPPPTPRSLVAAVDAMAVEHLAAPAGARRSWREGLGMGARGFRLAAGAVAMVAAVAVVGLVLLQARGRMTPDVAAPVPTLPAFTGPALPSAAATPTRLGAAWWVDADTAVALVRDRPAFRVSADGGQTWSEERRLPDHATDLGFGFTDATHGYSMWTVGAAGEAQTFVVDLTDDGGRTWRKTTAGSLPASTGADVLGNVHFSDAAHGIALGTLRATATDGYAFGRPLRCLGWATDDAGATWTDIPDAPCLWGGVSWQTSTLGYVVLPDRGITMTTDGGRTWVNGALPDQEGPGVEIWPMAAAATPAGAVRLVGRVIPEAGDAAWMLATWETADGGATWREVRRIDHLPDSRRLADLNAISTLSADHWLGVVADQYAPLDGSILFETVDGGRSWAVVGRTDIGTGGGVAWADRLHGSIQGSVLIPNPDGSANGYITTWLTNDGGRTWHEVPF
jgi:hypothetical protein